MYFCFCQCFIRRTQKANTTGGHKSHLCFPMINNWNTNKGLFDSLFVFPIEWHQTKKNKRRHIQEILLFCYHFLHCELKETKLCITDHISIYLFFVYELGKGKRKTNLPFSIFYYGFGKRKTKGRYIQQHTDRVVNHMDLAGIVVTCMRRHNNEPSWWRWFNLGLITRLDQWMITMMIIGTTTIMIMIVIITTTLTMTIMKMIMVKTAQTPCQSLYKDRRETITRINADPIHRRIYTVYGTRGGGGGGGGGTSCSVCFTSSEFTENIPYCIWNAACRCQVITNIDSRLLPSTPEQFHRI